MKGKARGLILLLVLAGAAGGVSCGSSSRSSSGQLAVAGSTASTAPTVSSTTPVQAMAAYSAFVGVYWDPNTWNFFKDSAHPISIATIGSILAGQLYSDFWWEAHFLEVTLDAYELTGGAVERQRIDEVYDGFVAMPWHAWTTNPYNDDLGWWCVALARAFEVTGETRFRDRAAAIFASIAAFEDATYGGGVWWKRDGTGQCKTVCINAPFALAALHLYSWTGDPAYLARAQRAYSFLESRLVQGAVVNDDVDGTGVGSVVDSQYTYNYGTFIGASLALADATGDPSYVANALAAADEAIATLTVNGILKDEGSGDCSGFKMILTRYLYRLAQRGYPQIAAFLDENARTAWSNRRADGLMGEDWSTPAPSSSIQSFAAGCALDVQFHAVFARWPRAAPPPTTALSPLPDATITADQATLQGVALGTQNPGFTGTAYVTSWSQPGQSVAFAFDAPSAGEYQLVFRYSAGSGQATRGVSVNGAGVTFFSLSLPMTTGMVFPATPAWGDWREASVLVDLAAGPNTISIAFDAASGSTGTLDLDALGIAPSPAW